MGWNAYHMHFANSFVSLCSLNSLQFRPERIAEIAQRFELDPGDVLDNIAVARAYTSDHQIELLDHVAARMASDRFSLLVIDSATALFRVDFSGRGELADRQQKLNSRCFDFPNVSFHSGTGEHSVLTSLDQTVAQKLSYPFEPSIPQNS